MKRENAGSWNSRLEKEQILETYYAQHQKSWNFTENHFGISKKYWAKKAPEGAHLPSTRVEGAPYPPGGAPCLVGPLLALRWPSSAIWSLSSRKKNHKQPFGTRLRRHVAEPWRNQSRVLAGLFCRGNFPPGGGNRHHRHHHRSSHREGFNLHQHLHQHHLLSDPSSSLVFNLCTGTSDWCLWVTSRVDYILYLMLVGLLGGRSYVQIHYAY